MTANDSQSTPHGPENAPERRCAECGKLFQNTGRQRNVAKFCCPEHRAAFHGRQKAQGALVIGLLKGWAASRNIKGCATAGKCMSEMTSIVSTLLEQDREAGRSNQMTIDYANELISETRWIDRRRS